MIHEESHELAGKTVILDTGEEFLVEDWADRVFGRSVWAMNGNPAALRYAAHTAQKNLPIDSQILYGKVNGLGRLVHVSEIIRDPDGE